MGQLNEFGQAGQIKETSIECYDCFPYIESKSHTLQTQLVGASLLPTIVLRYVISWSPES